MAAALAAEGSQLPCTGARSEHNGTGGLVHCFVCGSGVTPGKELRLQVTYQREKVPFFPFLQNQEPAPGASGLSPDGHTLVCAVCHCFLTEQWNIFERNRTPVEKRMYWLKRPYQCDSRRVPQEWNLSYDLERRVSGSGGGSGHHCESDFSSFSDNDNLSDHDMDLDRAAPSKDKCPRAAGRKNNVITVKNSPDSQRSPLAVYPAQGSPKADRTAPPRRAAKMTGNSCQSAETAAKCHDISPCQRRYDGPPSDAPAQDNGLITRNRPWPSGGNMRHAPHLFRPTGEAHLDLLRSPLALALASDNCDEDEVNITSDDDFLEASYGRKSNPRMKLRPDRAPPSARKSSQWKQGADAAHVCYICGGGLKLGRYQVSVQKQERARGEPFFPFLWLHSPPQGAAPISAAGTTQVCGSCHASLMQQWHSFQLADVPVLQRLYMVPLNQSSASSPRPHGSDPKAADERRWQRPPSSRQESCFLCGQEAGGDMKVVQAHAGTGKARAAMYFPFLDSLPCPPDAQRARNGVLCCSPCHSILEEIWAAYRLTLSQELITSVGPFLLRYHATAAAAGVQEAGLAGGVTRTGSTTSASACYLCGAELGAAAEYQLHVNPPGSCREREPFFPFLTVHPPALGAKPADATGLVSACTLCYHDLQAQWAQHEAVQPPSSPWARQYSCETFVCFFCGRERRRQGRLAAVGVARLPVFLYAPRDSRTLLVDDGRALAVGSCLECKSVVQVGGGSTRSEPPVEEEAKESHESRLKVRVVD